MRRRGGVLGTLVDHPWYVVLVAVVVAFTWWAVGTRTSPHHLRAYFPSAFNLVTGQNVNIDGITAGKVTGLEFDGSHAIVDVGINDDRFWPLHQGTQLTSRWGTTIGSGTRYLDLVPGPSSAPQLPENGIVPTRDDTPAIDVDQLLNVFNPQTRAGLRGWMQGMNSALGDRAASIGAAIHQSAPALDAVSGVMHDLSADSYALRTFITNTHAVTANLAGRSGALEGVISGAAATFNAFAANSNSLSRSIHDLPATLAQTQSTLSRTNSSIDKLHTLMVALAPGAARLAPLAQAASPALSSLRAMLPSAIGTVDSATSSLPALDALMHSATPFVQHSPYSFKTLGNMAQCITPYAPELAGGLQEGSSLVSDYTLAYPKLIQGNATNDPAPYVGAMTAGRVHWHHVDAMPMVSADSFQAQVLSPQAFTQATGRYYAFPRPPGLNVGQPWYLPQCEITPAALNPAADPESHTP